MSGGTVHLDSESVEAVARLVAELLSRPGVGLGPSAPATGRTLSTAETAKRFGVSQEYLRSHAVELQAGRMSNGPKGRFRFDPAIVAAHLGPRPDPLTKPSAPSHRSRHRTPSDVELLPVKGDE